MNVTLSEESIGQIASQIALALGSRQTGLLLNTKDAAEYLGVHVNTFRIWCVSKPGFPQPIRVNKGNPYWKRAELKKWVERIQ